MFLSRQLQLALKLSNPHLLPLRLLLDLRNFQMLDRNLGQPVQLDFHLTMLMLEVLDHRLIETVKDFGLEELLPSLQQRLCHHDERLVHHDSFEAETFHPLELQPLVENRRW